MANEENILMPDIPVPDNCAIIIFSATGGGTTEGGRIRQNIAFTAKTAVSISGGMLTDWVRIKPNGNTFTAAARFHKASGSGTFTATVTTAGDTANGLQGVTVDFSFRVLVLGVDFPHLSQSFYEFPVGAKVAVTLPVFFAAQQAQLNLPKVPSAIVSQTYGELESYTDEGHGGITRQRWVGEESGISIKPSLDGQNYVRGAGLTGIALRPGIYYRTFDISSYDNGGGYDPFPGANGSGIVIINIYDDRESPKVVVPYSHVPEDDFIRVIRHGIEGYTAARLTGEFTRSGDTWTRRVAEAISVNASNIWEYLMARNTETGVWTLTGRNYRSGETVPDYAALATASGRFGEVPPNTGWTGGILCAGDADFFVPDHGFFDRKGERTIGEFTGPVYEQQPMVAAQHAGWTNPPATRFADGLYLAPDAAGAWRISADPAAVDGAEVETRTIQHAAIPYHPATAGHPIAGRNYRDFALLAKQADGNPVAINAGLPTGGNLALQTGRYAAGVPGHYPWLRQLPPPMEAGVTRDIPFRVEEETIVGEHGCEIHWISTNSSVGSKWRGRNRKDPRTVARFSGIISADAWMRLASDTVGQLIGHYESGGGAAIEYTYDSNEFQDDYQWSSSADGTSKYTTKTDTNIYKERSTGDGAGNADVLAAFASGRNETDFTAGACVAGCVRASGSVSTQRTREWTTQTETTGGEVTRDSGSEIVLAATRGVSLDGHSPHPMRTGISSLTLNGVTVTTVNSSLAGDNTWSWETSVDGEVGGSAVSATHYRVVYSGTNKPPALIDEGWTHIVRTYAADGRVEDTWYNDPSGGTFDNLHDEFGSDINFDDMHVPNSTYFMAFQTSSREETITKRIEMFGE